MRFITLLFIVFFSININAQSSASSNLSMVDLIANGQVTCLPTEQLDSFVSQAQFLREEAERLNNLVSAQNDLTRLHNNEVRFLEIKIENDSITIGKFNDRVGRQSKVIQKQQRKIEKLKGNNWKFFVAGIITTLSTIIAIQ